MLDGVMRFRKRHANILLDRERAALLVLDMQEYFLRPDSHAFIPSSAAIVPNIQRIIEAYYTAGRPIIFTRHLNTDLDAGMMSHWWRDVLRAESELSSIVALDISKGTVIEKSQYDAFYRTELESILRGRGVEQVVITGVMTHLCCETTARSAFVRGLEVYFCIDGTATYTEELHRASLLNISHGFAIPIKCSEV